MKILFITWDGPQVNYLESLFLPIFKELSKTYFDFHILQFTWGDPNRINASRQACIDLGFTYQAETIWRRPLSVGALFTAIHGSQIIRRVIDDQQIDAAMPRSTLPALATLLALRGRSLPMIFDADGLPLDERVDFAGQSSFGVVYRMLRDVEAQAVRRADVVLTRSKKAIEILHARAGAGTSIDKFHVVSNGRDSESFKPADASVFSEIRKSLDLKIEAPLVIYAGSLGGKYCLKEMLQFFSFIHARRKDSKLVILTSYPDLVVNMLKKFPLIRSNVISFFAPNCLVAKYLSCADLGLAFITPSYSMQAVSAIKIGEYLLSGLPVIGTPGIGDSTEICARSGYLLKSMTEKDLTEAADWFLDSVLPQREIYRASSRAVGLSRFSLERCALSYQNAFQHLNYDL